MILFFIATILEGINNFKKRIQSQVVLKSEVENSTLFDEFNRVLRSNNEDQDLHHLPAVLVDLNAFDRNISFIRDQMLLHPHITVRVASKSIRIPFLLERVLTSGAPYKGLMCFAVEEAEFLANLGFDDFLIAYPSQQKLDYAILRNLHEIKKKTVSIVVDDLRSIEELNRYMNGISKPFPVILEFDASFRALNGWLHVGARRSPIRTLEHLVNMIESIQNFSSVQLIGLMVYESHIAGIGDLNPANGYLNLIIRFLKYLSIPKLQKIHQNLSQICRKYDLKILNGGGTGSFMSVLEENAVLSEVTIGSGFFQPHLFDHYQQNQMMIEKYGSTFTPSCYFALPIVRISDPDQWITCSGGGYVASGRPGWDKVPIPVYPIGLTLNDSEGTGEVQTPLTINPKRRLQIMNQIQNDRIVYFRHAKGGELSERFNHFLLIRDGELVEIAKTYRGYGKCFL